MAESQLLKTSIFATPHFRDLKEFEEKLFYFYLNHNPWVTATGIYKFYSEMASDLIGKNKHDDSLLSNARIKELLKILVDKNKIKYSPENHMLWSIHYYDFVPFGNGAPEIIATRILKDFKQPEIQIFLDDYKNYNKETILKWFADKKADSQDKYKKTGKIGNLKKFEKAPVTTLLNILNDSQ